MNTTPTRNGSEFTRLNSLLWFSKLFLLQTSFQTGIMTNSIWNYCILIRFEYVGYFLYFDKTEIDTKRRRQILKLWWSNIKSFVWRSIIYFFHKNMEDNFVVFIVFTINYITKSDQHTNFLIMNGGQLVHSRWMAPFPDTQVKLISNLYVSIIWI